MVMVFDCGFFKVFFSFSRRLCMDSATRQISQAYWWLILLRGVIALLFGIVALISVQFVLLFLVYLFGAYVLLDGIMAIIVSLQERRSASGWWVIFLLGIVGVIVGFLCFIHPGNVALLIFYLVAIWLIISGLFVIISAFTLRAAGAEWLLVVVGVISIIVGIIFFIHPTSSILSLVWLLGVFALVYGIVQIVRAMQLRSLLSV
jgi:uncharacterized membrane protein HdeD (DUF308 family)